MNDASDHSHLHPLLARLRMEPWGVEYLGSVHDTTGLGGVGLGEDDEQQGEAGELLADDALSVEVAAAEWRPLTATRPARVERVMFLDGVRRIEARTYLEDQPTVFGALGSCAVGAVSSQALSVLPHASEPVHPAAEFIEPPVVQRWLALGGGRSDLGFATLEVGAGAQVATYRVTTDAGTDKDAPVRALQARMQEAERDLAARLLPQLGDGLLVCDGPRPQLGADARVLGYVKTVHAQRLPAGALEAVRALKQGERSPMYLVGSGGFARFEWYLRLRDPGPWLHTLAGSVRLQAHAGPDPSSQLERARSVADWSCLSLPRFATHSHQDPRAPQQLLPVRALEQSLRRRLGSAPLLRRRMVSALAGGS